MITLYPHKEIYHARAAEWLNSWHHFSFAEYWDPSNLGHGPIRVWNDDYVAGENGFPFHPHREMEIVSYIISGELSHEDSLGHKGTTRVGDIQYMSAGTGIRHSEMNNAKETCHLYQIWIQPSRNGIEPRYGQYTYGLHNLKDQLFPIISGEGVGPAGTPILHQHLTLYASMPSKGWKEVLDGKKEHGMYLVCAAGQLQVNDIKVNPGDAVRIMREETIEITALEDSHFVLAVFKACPEAK